MSNCKKIAGKIPTATDALIEKELNNIFEPTVKLKSGGYLVINPKRLCCNRYKFRSINKADNRKNSFKYQFEKAEEITRQLNQEINQA